MTRSEPRAEALQALYAADMMEVAPDPEGLPARAAALVAGVWAERGELDRIIGRLAVGWRVERMPVVDRNILRIGVYELLRTDTAVGIVVSEAVELAKRYSTSRSGPFVNGVLGRLAEEQRGDDATPAGPAPGDAAADGGGAGD